MYPIELFKQDCGNLVNRRAVDAENEKLHRSAGFVELEELYPSLPTAEDLDAVADEAQAVEATSKKRGRK